LKVVGSGAEAQHSFAPYQSADVKLERCFAPLQNGNVTVQQGFAP
jgi:hypothetical protein